MCEGGCYRDIEMTTRRRHGHRTTTIVGSSDPTIVGSNECRPHDCRQQRCGELPWCRPHDCRQQRYGNRRSSHVPYLQWLWQHRCELLCRLHGTLVATPLHGAPYRPRRDYGLGRSLLRVPISKVAIIGDSAQGLEEGARGPCLRCTESQWFHRDVGQGRLAQVGPCPEL